MAKDLQGPQVSCWVNREPRSKGSRVQEEDSIRKRDKGRGKDTKGTRTGKAEEAARVGQEGGHR